MFPLEKLTSSGMNSLLFYISILGILLFVGVILRTRVNIFKRFFIPASLIAGFLGLILGQHGLQVLPAEMMSSFSALPGSLIVVVFAPMLMGISFPKPKEMSKIVGPQLIFGYVGVFLMIGIACLVTALIITPLWNIDEMFGTIIEVGFTGGHGTAAAMGSVYSDLGWTAGGSLGLTVATIGLLIGIVGGMIIINYGVRKGYTSILKADGTVKAFAQKDLISKKEQKPAAMVTINKEVVEPLAFHLALISIAIIIGWILLYFVKSVTGLKMPMFPMAMIGGLIVQFLISKTKLADSVDVGMLRLIQGLALELLIVAAISTIKVPVVIEYALPLIVISVSSIACLLFYFFYLGPRFFKRQWFEHAIINFGTLAGVTAVGLMLLRTVDPEMKSEVFNAFALRAPFFSPFVGGGLVTSLLPLLAFNYGALTISIIFLAIVFLLCLLARWLGYWQSPEKVL